MNPRFARYLFSVFAWLALYSGLVACQSPEKPYAGWGFLVTVPSDLTIQKKRPVEDFETYTFQRAAQPLLFLYAGDNPDFGKAAPSSARRRDLTIGAAPAIWIDWSDAQRNACGEVLLKLSSPLGLPSRLHFSYCGLSSQNLEVARRIIESARASQ